MDRRARSSGHHSIRQRPSCYIQAQNGVASRGGFQGSSIADRPRLVAAGEIPSRGLFIVLAPAGSTWRRMRSTPYGSPA
ncbi:hypothetical protein BDR03DRAFT_945721 [Suillus americanus]|nr:hypothetical protein BDR03DRAFT_945721 [Suillus americanus]